RHRLEFRETDSDGRRKNQIDSTGQSDTRISAAQAVARFIDGDERGRASRVDADARTRKVEKVGEAVRADAERASGDGVAVADVVNVRELLMAVVAARHTDKDPHPLAGKLLDGTPGVLQALPRGLHQEALLRIDVHRLTRRNPE